MTIRPRLVPSFGSSLLWFLAPAASGLGVFSLDYGLLSFSLALSTATASSLCEGRLLSQAGVRVLPFGWTKSTMLGTIVGFAVAAAVENSLRQVAIRTFGIHAIAVWRPIAPFYPAIAFSLAQGGVQSMEFRATTWGMGVWIIATVVATVVCMVMSFGAGPLLAGGVACGLFRCLVLFQIGRQLARSDRADG
jgi:hypothetical protein